MNFFATMFSESSGRPSSMRFMSFLVLAVILGCWADVTIRKNEMQPLTFEQMGLVLGAMGIKVWQKGKENGGGDTSFLKNPNPLPKP
jgi:hypothetical protein